MLLSNVPDLYTLVILSGLEMDPGSTETDLGMTYVTVPKPFIAKILDTGLKADLITMKPNDSGDAAYSITQHGSEERHKLALQAQRDLTVLNLVRKNPGCELMDIAELLKVKAPAAEATLLRLVDSGYLTDDERGIMLTKAGAKYRGDLLDNI